MKATDTPMPTPASMGITMRVLAERQRQDALHGAAANRGYAPEAWLAVLVEEVGEVASAIQARDPSEMVAELLQVAAVAIATIEAVEAGDATVRLAERLS
jgi:NTP pyrophosphatase (non-canonical NTP hydrolase)